MPLILCFLCVCYVFVHLLGCRVGHLESVRLSESYAKYQTVPGGTIAGKPVAIQEDWVKLSLSVSRNVVSLQFTMLLSHFKDVLFLDFRNWFVDCHLYHAHCPSQSVFKDKIRFNSHYAGSDVLPNTCNVSILGPALQGDVITPSSLSLSLFWPASPDKCPPSYAPMSVHDLERGICEPQNVYFHKSFIILLS